jgi:hypothetical protein
MSHHQPSGEITPLATAICCDDADPALLAQAQAIAQNEMALRAIRDQQTAVVERLREPMVVANDSQFGVLAELKAVLERHTLEEARALDFTGKQIEQQQRDEHEALKEAIPDLSRLKRYERRAWSRQLRAIREFLNIQFTRAMAR